MTMPIRSRAKALIASGKFHLAIAAPVAWCGIIGGDCVLYHLGKKYGLEITRLPLIGKHEQMVATARALYEELRRRHAVEYDDSGAIGRRYRRQDEIGTPFAFTIDEQTLEDDTVTVRDRDSLAQERLPLGSVAAWLDQALERPWSSPKA